MKTSRYRRPDEWLTHFRERANQDDWREPAWGQLPDSSLAPSSRRHLAESLAIFQLGETGGGSRLRAFVERELARPDSGLSSDYGRAVESFLGEEHEHARLLAELVNYLGGRLHRRHWLNGAFRRVRTILGLEFNLQVLLTAELIAEAYYGMLYQRVPDPVVRQVCGRIVRDEIGHIGFHQSFFRWRQKQVLPGATSLWSLQFQLLFLVAEFLAWRHHRRCLEEFGIGRREFARRARGVCRRFLLVTEEQDDGEMMPGENGENARLVAGDPAD